MGGQTCSLPFRVARCCRLTPYYDLLQPVCAHIDIWHSVYNHVMATPQAIVEWFKGSSLQPYLSLLDAGMREQFLAAYTRKNRRCLQAAHQQ